MASLCVLSVVTVSILAAEDLRIGRIEFWGLHNIPEERIRSVLHLREGDAVTPSDAWGDSLRKRIEAITGISRVSLDLGCCDEGGRATVTVGIVEEGSPTIEFRSAPASPVRLPKQIVDTYRLCMDAWEHAVRVGDNHDNVEEGHSLMANRDVRAIQLSFIPLARRHLAILRTVLRHSASDEHRAAAAWVLGYAPNKASVTEDLIYAAGDPNELVRNNAMRSLWAIAALAARKPQLRIRIPAGLFIDLLNSIVASDRNKALAVLGEITRSRTPAVVADLRDRALPALLTMARRRDGFAAYTLLGRMAGMSEERISETWISGDRGALLSNGFSSPQ